MEPIKKIEGAIEQVQEKIIEGVSDAIDLIEQPLRNVGGKILEQIDERLDFAESLVENLEGPVNNFTENVAGAISEVSDRAVRAVNVASSALSLIPDPLKLLNDNTSVALNSQVALGFAMPPVLPMKELGLPGIMPKQFQNEMSFWLDEEKKEEGFTLPIDPLITINGENSIVRRIPLICATSGDSGQSVFKRGSVKEYWNRSDYRVEIRGTLCGENQDILNKSIKELVKYCEAEGHVNVECKVMNNVYNIHCLAIEKYEFPFTQGEEYQNFIIKAYSDNSHELLEIE